jgi:tripartite-type tricarboxylate transporter receptor subunit TctC
VSIRLVEFLRKVRDVLPRRRFLLLAAALAAVSEIARAQTYPERPVRLVAPGLPGDTADLFARLYGEWLAQRLDRPFIIENRAGAGGSIATEAVARAPPDGYTLLWVTSANAWNATLYAKANFNFIHDIAPVASSHRGYGVLVVHPSFPAKTVPEFTAYARANPGKINMASGGVGSGPHLWGELFKIMAGVDMLHVPYRGGGPALAALLSGQVQAMFDTVATSIGHIRSGNLRALAVTAGTRLEVLPDISTMGEFVPGYEASGWGGLGAPRDTPSEIVEKLNNEINAALAHPAIRVRIAGLGSVPMPMTPADFTKFIVAETDKWAKVIKFAGIKPV